MGDDLRAALRSLTTARTFTAVALVLLTLGIGATTAIFSVVDAVVLRGLPFDEHDRLVAEGERRPPNAVFGQTAPRDPLQLSAIRRRTTWTGRRDQSASSSRWRQWQRRVCASRTGQTEELRAQRVTASFLRHPARAAAHRPHVHEGA